MSDTHSSEKHTHQPFQFAIVRFVDDLVRDEPHNIGVVVRAVETRKLEIRLLSDRSREWSHAGTAARSIAGNLATQLNAAAAQLTKFGRIGNVADNHFLERARAEFNGHVQLSPTRGLLANSMDDAIKEVFDRYVKNHHTASQEISSILSPIAPSRVRQRLWSAFSRASLIRKGLVKKSYEVRGEHARWTFDVGYENGSLSLINSIALGGADSNASLSRALVLRGMIEEVRKVAKKDVRSTAVAAIDRSPGASSAVRQAEEIMGDSKIDIVNLDDLPNFVLRIGNELARGDAHRATN